MSAEQFSLFRWLMTDWNWATVLVLYAVGIIGAPRK